MEPWLRRGETEMNYKYFPHTTKKEMRWNRDNFTRGSLKDRVDSYTKMFQMGMMNSNEGRAREGMNPIDNGDTYFVQLNLIPLDQAVDMAASLNDQRDNRRQVDESARLGDVHVVFEAYFIRAVAGINFRLLTLDVGSQVEQRCLESLMEIATPVVTQYFTFLRLSGDDAVEVLTAFRKSDEIKSGNAHEQFEFVSNEAKTLMKRELQHE